MTPPPFPLKAKKSSGKPMAFPEKICLHNLGQFKGTLRLFLPNQSKTIVSNSVQAGLAAC